MISAISSTLTVRGRQQRSSRRPCARRFAISTSNFRWIHPGRSARARHLIPALTPDISEKRREEIEDVRAALFERDFLARVRPFPGIRPLFERLCDDGIAILLASSARQSEVDHHVDLLGCRDLLAATTSKDDVEHSKPAPDIFAAALAKVAPLTARDVLVVGDTPYDALAAGKLDIGVIGFRWGDSPSGSARRRRTLIFDGHEDMLVSYDRLFAGSGSAEIRPRLDQEPLPA